MKKKKLFVSNVIQTSKGEVDVDYSDSSYSFEGITSPERFISHSFSP